MKMGTAPFIQSTNQSMQLDQNKFKKKKQLIWKGSMLDSLE
jgi:hypothetical protein